ncbi:MAG: hypothetical protein FJ033_09775 [Chloroflexi bacterium]|nr:hypothetical protein [Chloroflexota bacterium]
MIRAASETRTRCADHPHRRATRKCARCGRPLCDECAAQLSARGQCALCVEELEEKHRLENPTWRERAERFGRSARNFIILTIIVIAIMIPIAIGARRLMDTPLKPEELARMRYALIGTFETAEGVNTTSTVLGATVVLVTSEVVGNEATRLNDEYVAETYGGYRTADDRFPVDVVFGREEPGRVEKLHFQQQPLEPVETHVRLVEVSISMESAGGPWFSLGEFALTESLEIQRHVLTGVRPYRWIRLRVLANGGGPYASLGEFGAFTLPRASLLGVTPSDPTVKP